MYNVRGGLLQGVKWTTISALASKVILFVYTLFIARLLSPSDFGVVGMAGIFFSLSQILIDCGLCSALIRKKDVSVEDSSTVFYFNIGVSFICCIVICLLAPQIAGYLHCSILTGIVRASAISMLFGSFGSVQWALLMRNVDFKTPALIRLPVQVVKGVSAILMAYRGMGAWSLVWASMIGCVLDTTIVWIVSSWRPRMIFSLNSFKELFGFSGNIAINSVLDCFYNEGTGMVIGRYYTPTQLGYYSKGIGFANLPAGVIFGVVGNVLLPVMSKIQDDDEQLIKMYKKVLRLLSLVIFFVMFQMASLAYPLTVLLFGDKWGPSVCYLQVASFTAMIYHIHAMIWNLLLAKGYSNWALKKEVFCKSINFACLGAGIAFGPIYICIGCLIASIGNLIVNCWVTNRLLHFGLVKHLSAIYDYFILGMLSTIPSVLLVVLGVCPIASIFIGGLFSATIYFGWLFWVKDECLVDLIGLTPLSRYLQFNR